jgi:cation:H+ antiporter
MTTLPIFLAGLAGLVAGAELLVRGASRIASALGISPLVVGLTVVAFGTSSPELAVSVGAALSGQGDIAVGNAVGSNIFNVLFILGLSALIAPMVVAQQLVRIDVPLMIGCSLLLFALVLDGEIGQGEGALLFAGIVAYTGFLIWQARREKNPEVVAEYAQAYPTWARRWMLNIAFVVVGLALLVAGARWLVEAAGTSLPEVAASVIAAVRGERDIAVGNVVGSNIYNILAVLGAAALVAPVGLPVAPSLLSFDLPVMTAVALASLPIFFTGYRIARWEGAVFLAYYAAYTGYVVLKATEHDLLAPFSMIMLAFVLPITVLTLAVLAYRAWRSNAPASR